MKLHALARELGVENKTLSELLDVGHHMTGLTDEQEDVARKAYASGVIKESSAKIDGKVKFWSNVREMKIMNGYDKLICFVDYAYIADDDSKEARVIRAAMAHNPDIKEVVDAPFEDDAEAADFRKMLSLLVYTGAMREISRERGMTAVRALFWPSELDTVSGPHNTPDRLIEKAVRMKSTKG